MAKVVTPIAAVVQRITAPKDGQYGSYQSVLFKTPTGEKIWKSFPPDSIRSSAALPAPLVNASSFSFLSSYR